MLVAKSPSGFDQRQNPFFKGELLQDGMEDALPGLELFGGMQTLSALCVTKMQGLNVCFGLRLFENIIIELAVRNSFSHCRDGATLCSYFQW
jgi:hypothetical protein